MTGLPIPLPAARAGADGAGGGILIPGLGFGVFINNLPVSVLGDAISPHGKSPHGSAKVVSGSTTVFINGLPAVRGSDIASCGHPINSNCLTVFIGG